MRYDNISVEKKLFSDEVKYFSLRYIQPYLNDWEKKKDYPADLHQRAAAAGLFKRPFSAMINDNDLSYLVLLNSQIVRHASQGVAVSLTAFFPILAILHQQAHQAFCQSALEQLLSGEAIVSFAVTEPEAGSDVTKIQTSLTVDSDGGAYLDGSKSFVCNADKASHWVIAVQYKGEFALILAERPDAADVVPVDMIGWRSLPVCDVMFEKTRLNNFSILGQGNQAKKLLFTAFNYERLNLSSMAITSAYVAYEEALKYAKARKCFGKELIKHQHIKYRLAVMHVKLEAIQSLFDKVIEREKSGIFCVDSIPVVKYLSARYCGEIVDEAFQLLAGKACIQGGVLERLYRDVRILRIGGGTDEMMLEVIAKSIEKMP